MSAFHFLRPWWWAALPVLLFLLWALGRRRLRSRSWQGVCDPALLPHLLLGRSRRRADWPLALMLAAVLLGVTALAGPTWRQRPQPLFRQQSALVICLDLSRSMLAADLKPSRLVRARLKIEDLLRQRREGQTALIAFAGDAFAVTPLTDDRHTIEALLATLTPELMPVQGSQPERALALGAEMIRRAGLGRGTLLLVTDEDRPERAAEAAAALPQQGMTLAVLGVGTPEGAPIPMEGGGFFKDATGSLVLPRLDEAGLTRLAAAGGGSYRRIRIDDNDFAPLLAHLDRHGLDSSGPAARRLGDQWEEAGVWLLWPLLALAAAAFRRGWLAVLAVMLVLPSGVRAAGWDDLWRRPDQQAYRAFQAERYDRAAAQFEDPRWKAGALYRAGKFSEAAEALPKPQSADDWYNRGNAMARGGRLREALAAYDQALAVNPDDADARENRRLVQEALDRQPKAPNPGSGADGSPSPSKKPPEAGDESGKQNQPPKGNENSQPQEGPPQASGGDEARDGAPKPDGAEASPAPEADSAPPSEETRSDADAGQGQPPQPAAQGRPQRPENGDPRHSAAAEAAGAEAEAPPDAESRQMQHWLQRIPDDPGGLMRRKFLHQYRQRGRQTETERPW